MKIKKFNEKFNEENYVDDDINKISRLLSDTFYPNVSKLTYPIKCTGFTDLDYNYEAYFIIWDDSKNDYIENVINTIIIPKFKIK